MSLFSYLSLRLLKWKSNNNLHIHQWQMYHLFYYISLILISFQNKSPNSMQEPRLTTIINTRQGYSPLFSLSHYTHEYQANSDIQNTFYHYLHVIISSNILIPNYSQLLQKEKQEKDGEHFISNLSFKLPSGACFPVLHSATIENTPCSFTSYINITK